MCDCLQIEQTLVAALSLLPDNEIADDYEKIRFVYCPVCGRRFEDVEQKG